MFIYLKEKKPSKEVPNIFPLIFHQLEMGCVATLSYNESRNKEMRNE